MDPTVFSVASLVVAWGLISSTTWAAGVPTTVEGGGAGRHLSASARVIADGVEVRVSHRSPGGNREPGAHLHVGVITEDDPIDVVRGIPPRSPRARMRASRDLILVTVPLRRSAILRGVRVVIVPGPHSGCSR